MNSVDPVTSARLRAAFAARSARAVPSPACPEPVRLWQALHGELVFEATAQVVDHTSSCPACAEAWRIGRDLAPRAPASGGTSSRWWGNPWVNVAALLIVALSISTIPAVHRRDVKGGRPEFRAPQGPTSVRALVPEDRPLPRTDVVLRWSPGPKGSRYNVRVATEELKTLIVMRDLALAEWRLPEGALAGLGPGARLLWQVEVRSPDGARYTSSTFIIRLE